jgi:hypothetical protein
MKLRVLAGCIAFLAAAGCSEPLVFPDWNLPLEPGTPIREYAAVPSEEREVSIEWVEELVIGDRGDTDLRYAFGRPVSVAVDARGQIYVVDGQTISVKVFDESGEYLRELGGDGQGPGEFQSPRSVASLDDRVIVGASRNARWSHFDLDGNHMVDHSYQIYDNLELVHATTTGDLIGATLRFAELDDVSAGPAAVPPISCHAGGEAIPRSPSSVAISPNSSWRLIRRSSSNSSNPRPV